MLFNSLAFLCFLPLVLLGYFLAYGRGKQIWLLAASYFFYMSWNPKYITLLLAYTAITYVSGRRIQWIYDGGRGRKKAKKYVIVGAAFCFAILFVFKYFNFFVSTIEDICGILHMPISVPHSDLLLPVGISFFAFQSVSYLIDVYRQEIQAEKSLLSYALFLSFFPQLVAGPIERYSRLMPQLKESHPFDYERVLDGLLTMLWGYFFKLVIADRAAIFVDQVYGNHEIYSGAMIALATILFAFQIYGDFAGYSTIALGVAKIMGIQLTNNFESPYLSESVKDFWRRWHISLNRWFRDYVYIPLGGNQGKFKNIRNILLTFVLSGLWHGANWTYVVWGLINGIYQIPGVILSRRQKDRQCTKRWGTFILLRGLKTICTFALIDISWLVFRATSLTEARDLLLKIIFKPEIRTLFNGSIFQCGIEKRTWIVLFLSILLMFIVDLCRKKGIDMNQIILKRNLLFQGGLTAVAIAIILIFGVWGAGYNPTGFIYFQF